MNDPVKGVQSVQATYILDPMSLDHLRPFELLPDQSIRLEQSLRG